MIKIIGLSGKKYSGKDTFYAALKEVYPKVVRIAFADSLKDEVYEAVLKPNGVPRVALDDERKKYFRLILQGWGGEFRRQFNSDTYWLDQVKKKVQTLKDQHFDGIVIITDVRYKNEADWVRYNGGHVVRVKRPGKGLMGFVKDKLGIVPDKHASECDLDKYLFDDYVVNNSTIEALNVRATELIRKYHLDQVQ